MSYTLWAGLSAAILGDRSTGHVPTNILLALSYRGSLTGVRIAVQLLFATTVLGTIPAFCCELRFLLYDLFLDGAPVTLIGSSIPISLSPTIPMMALIITVYPISLLMAMNYQWLGLFQSFNSIPAPRYLFCHAAAGSCRGEHGRSRCSVRFHSAGYVFTRPPLGASIRTMQHT